MKNQEIGYIICETATTTATETQVISDKDNRIKIEANIQDMERINRNGRFYARTELGPQLQAPRLLELLRTKNMFGEAGHPMSQELSRQQTIDPTNISHLFHKIWVDGNNIMAHITGAETARGDDFDRLVQSGTNPSFSLRALGTVNRTPRGSEVKNIRIITWDWVVFPSHDCTYMTNVVNESALVNESSNLILTESDKGLLVPLNNKKVTDYIKEESKNIKSAIESLEFMYESVSLSENGNQVKLKGKEETLVLNLESHIVNEIRDYCYSKRR